MESRESKDATNRLVNYGLIQITHAGSSSKKARISEIVIAPDILIIQTGEDIVEKVKSFVLNQGKRVVNVVFACGSVSCATIHLPLFVGGFMYSVKGKYKIISLKGNLSPSENNVDDQNSSSITGSIKILIMNRLNDRMMSGEAVNVITLSEITVLVKTSAVTPPTEE